MNQNSSSRFTPILLALCLVAGILIGTFYANHFSGNRLNIINTNSNKVNDLLRIIDDQYVDTVNMTDLVEKAMPRILAELDPHSAYTTAKETEAAMESLKGSFFRHRRVFHQTKRHSAHHSVSSKAPNLKR